VGKAGCDWPASQNTFIVGEKGITEDQLFMAQVFELRKSGNWRRPGLRWEAKDQSEEFIG
jgi:hypothetical protein